MCETQHLIHTVYSMGFVDIIMSFDTRTHAHTHIHIHTHTHTNTYTHTHTQTHTHTDSNFQPFWSSMRTWQNCLWVSLTIFFATRIRACAGYAKLRPLWATPNHVGVHVQM